MGLEREFEKYLLTLTKLVISNVPVDKIVRLYKILISSYVNEMISSYQTC